MKNISLDANFENFKIKYCGAGLNENLLALNVLKCIFINRKKGVAKSPNQMNRFAWEWTQYLGMGFMKNKKDKEDISTFI